MKKLFALVAAAFVVAPFSALSLAGTVEEIDAPEGYNLVWHDEFDGDSLNASCWTLESKPAGWVNHELQTYVTHAVDSIRTVRLDDGRLLITAFKGSDGKVYSGRVYANVDSGWKYGIFEARIKLPKGKGTWPAFWMMPVRSETGNNRWPDCGEIDIMEEVGFNPDRTSSSIHCKAYNHVIRTQKTAERHTPGAEGDFHTYRLQWDADAIRTFVDGNPLFTFENDGEGNPDTWPFSKPFYLILNLAWGGDWGGATGVDETALPAVMEVDYVRVYQPE